ncbi:FMN-binding negative transcriptional regulator [bacterium]|nr:FMN-binding negative transcriptional regulator [bacterium]
MYVPKHFDEPRIEVLHQLMRARPLATLVTHSAGSLDANHIPLHLSIEPAPLGALRGHVARANPVWRDVAPGVEVLAIFHGPEAYVTPSWYPTKAENGKAVPTWNYAVVHAHGSLRIIDDPAWLRASLESLTAENEAAFAEPWRMDEAPADYIEAMLRAVVGIEITITRLEGKWKTSQNQPQQNRAGAAAGLRADGRPESLAMAELIEAAK